MLIMRSAWGTCNKLLLTILVAGFLVSSLPAAALEDRQEGTREKKAALAARSDSGTGAVRLTIVVTAGEDKKPVDSASVYVKYVEGRTLAKDKKIEMNLKTNQSGICHVPEIARRKILIQVIAPGWKTFGEYYSPDQAEQTIEINLQRPPKWY